MKRIEPLVKEGSLKLICQEMRGLANTMTNSREETTTGAGMEDVETMRMKKMPMNETAGEKWLLMLQKRDAEVTIEILVEKVKGSLTIMISKLMILGRIRQP